MRDAHVEIHHVAVNKMIQVSRKCATIVLFLIIVPFVVIVVWDWQPWHRVPMMTDYWAARDRATLPSPWSQTINRVVSMPSTDSVPGKKLYLGVWVDDNDTKHNIIYGLHKTLTVVVGLLPHGPAPVTIESTDSVPIISARIINIATGIGITKDTAPYYPSSDALADHLLMNGKNGWHIAWLPSDTEMARIPRSITISSSNMIDGVGSNWTEVARFHIRHSDVNTLDYLRTSDDKVRIIYSSTLLLGQISFMGIIPHIRQRDFSMSRASIYR